MKLTHNSSNEGLDRLIEYAHPSDVDYGHEEVIEFLVMMDSLDISVVVDMLIIGGYDDWIIDEST